MPKHIHNQTYGTVFIKAHITEAAMIQVIFRGFDYAKDLERLYLYFTGENQLLFSHGFQIHNLPMFDRWISEKFTRSDYHDFFMIEDTAGNTVGFTFSYEFFPYDGHCKYTLCLYEEYQNCGLGAPAAIRMVDYLLRKYPLKRVFVSVFDYNKNSLQINLKAGMKEVAMLPDYRFYGGSWFGLHILTISREEFYTRYGKVIPTVMLDGR